MTCPVKKKKMYLMSNKILTIAIKLKIKILKACNVIKDAIFHSHFI